MLFILRYQHLLSKPRYNFFTFLVTRNFGSPLGEKFWFHPDYRVEQHRFVERTVHERFPNPYFGYLESAPQVIAPDLVTQLLQPRRSPK